MHCVTLKLDFPLSHAQVLGKKLQLAKKKKVQDKMVKQSVWRGLHAIAQNGRLVVDD